MVDLKNVQEHLDAYRQQQNNRTKINKLLDDLYGIVVETDKLIHMWRQIRTLVSARPEVADLFSHFLITTGKLLIERAVVDISKIFDKGKDSVNNQFFINLLQHEGKESISPEAMASLKKLVAEYEGALQVHNNVILQMKAKRDKELAHLDKSMLGDIFGRQINIEVEEIELILKLLNSMYSECYSICGFHKMEAAEESLKTIDSMGFPTSFDKLIRVVDYALDNALADEQDVTIKSLQFGRLLRTPIKMEYES
jgi:F0F1-type ATP synthase delta subunit